jgi:PleD family two-component response regulator
MKILIIEDESEIATNIKNYLSSNDFVCELAPSLKVAIAKIDLYSYDCILLDLMLTDGDGFKILELLKSQNKTEGVIIISAKDTLESKIEGLTLGADDYLTKRKFLGNYHKIKGKHLQLYLIEFISKLNRRYFEEKLFDRLLITGITGI